MSGLTASFHCGFVDALKCLVLLLDYLELILDVYNWFRVELILLYRIDSA